MTRITWLKNKHAEIDAKVLEIEKQREHERSFEHKAMLVDLKKQKLIIKQEIQTLSSST
jgi:uncharacterized protein YdcH (DUF465 family)